MDSNRKRSHRKTENTKPCSAIFSLIWHGHKSMKNSYLLHLSFFSPPHNSLLVSVKKKKKKHPPLLFGNPSLWSLPMENMGDRFCTSLKVLFKVQVAKLLQRIQANVWDTGDMRRRGRCRAALPPQLKETKNTGLTKPSITTPGFKLQQRRRKQPSGPRLLCEPWHVQQGYFVFLLVSADWQKIWLMSLGTWPRRCLVITV